MTYPKVDPQPNFPAVENETLDFWASDGTFQASIDQRDAGTNGANEYVFYDGPPFANGLPHYGHLLTGFVKDAVPRYQTMQGKRVERRFGWDCHGLPAEAEAERQLGISGRQAITDFGIDKFNEYCRESVLRYTGDWERYVTRQARWVDFAHDYKTLDVSYMESVMWAFKTLWDKGLIYEGFRVLPYSWALETPLSNTETRMDDAYKQVQDPALTVAFVLETGESLLAWTTTPWTLPSNLALAVAPDVSYVRVRHNGTMYILAEARLGAYEKELEGAEVIDSMLGSALVGRTYTPMFSYFADQPDAFRIIAGDFVTTEDGTGVVHLAPGFGEDDQRVCSENGIGLVVPVDSRGLFTSEVPDFFGMLVFDANPLIIRELKSRGVVLRHETYDHAYPHCWRTGKPLIYKAVSSWFVNVTAVKERMVALNEEITWVPDHLKHGSFGKWLENARDWTISRNRFWGSPIPVWRSDDPAYPRIDVYGSLADLERDFGVTVTELHRPVVDDLVRPNPDDPTGKSMMRRVPEVLDCWFESGSMPFAQVHYPFENQEWFDQHYPGDFIVEYIGQTRGWFYTLHVLATALFDRPAFSTCVSHGIVLGDDGAKMSKSLRNYPDPMNVFDTYGADAMRWYLLSSSILRGSDFAVTEEGIRDTVRQVMLPLWNSWYFLSLYANAESMTGAVRYDSTNVLDRYVFSKLKRLIEDTTVSMDQYDIFNACQQVRTFLDVLTNWYIRRSRDRFWKGDKDAIDTLHTVLQVLTRIAAPLLPLTTEKIYKELTGERSVHLENWPDASIVPSDEELEKVMDQVRDVCSTTLSLRKVHSRRVRLPLGELTVASPLANALQSFVSIITDEVNVHQVTLTTELGQVAKHELQLIPAALGPRLGANTQKVIVAVKKGDWSINGDEVIAGGVALEPHEFQVRLVAAAGDTELIASAALADGQGIVLLNIELTDALLAEGAARDIVRMVQQARREAGLAVSDRINLTLGLPESLQSQVSQFEPYIASETLAQRIEWVQGLHPTGDLDGNPVHIGVDQVR
ncbi:isoleucine--tRNA ligase [bacterium]|nr:isoleucine--tRNA ligase [bacterium]